MQVQSRNHRQHDERATIESQLDEIKQEVARLLDRVTAGRLHHRSRMRKAVDRAASLVKDHPIAATLVGSAALGLGYLATRIVRR